MVVKMQTTMGGNMDKLNGWKVYATAVAAILTATVAYFNHAITLPEYIAAIFAAVQTMNIRHAITTTVSNATDKKL